MPLSREDVLKIEMEQRFWQATPQLRWFRPPKGDDCGLQLQQLWERITGEREWRPVPTCFAD